MFFIDTMHVAWHYGGYWKWL